MKKTIVLVLALLLAHIACVPTPDDEAIVQKNQDEMLQQASATSETTTYIAQSKEYKFHYTEEMLEISIDTQIVVQNSVLPIARVNANGFKQETVTALYNVLTNGETCYMDLNNVQTKDEIAQELASMISALDDGSYAQSDLDEDEWKAAIEELQQAYQNAPEQITNEKHPSDGTMKTAKDSWGSFSVLDAYSTHHHFYVSSSIDNHLKSIFRYERVHSPEYSMRNAIKITEMTEQSDQIQLSYQEAIKTAKELMNVCGIPMNIRATYLIDDSHDSLSESGETPGVNYAYRIFLGRVLSNVNVAIDETETSSNNDVYQQPWVMESAQITIDANGIASFQWVEPLEVDEIVINKSNLLPFSDIQAIAEKMLPIIYRPITPTDTLLKQSYKVTCNDIRLELVRVREQNATKSLRGFLVPAWVFYGQIIDTRLRKEIGQDVVRFRAYGGVGGGSYYKGPTVILCINAVDGSIINPILGY